MSVVRDPRVLSDPGSTARGPRPAAGERVRLLRAPLVTARCSPDELAGLRLEPGTRDVARRLFARGASLEFVRSILGEVLRNGGRGAHALDRAAEALARAVPASLSPRRPTAGARVPLIAVVGPTGVGKTTVLAELGRQMQAAGRRVAFAGLDAATLEALEKLGGTTARGRSPGQPSAALDAVLLDTPGLSPREPERLEALARALARRASPFELQTLLVLSCAAARSALALTLRAFTPFRAAGAVLTRLDETDEPAPAFEVLARARLPLAFVCEGRAHLARATRETLPDFLLGGRARRIPNDEANPT